MGKEGKKGAAVVLALDPVLRRLPLYTSSEPHSAKATGRTSPKRMPGGAYMHDDEPAALYSSQLQRPQPLGGWCWSPPLL